MNGDASDKPRNDRIAWLDEMCVELALLVPREQVARLIRLAAARGLTVGQLIRRLLDDYLACHDPGARPGQSAALARVEGDEEPPEAPKGGQP